MAKHRFDLRGKTVLVAGASSGIGRTAAVRMAAEGARVAVTARRSDRLASLVDEIAQAGGTAVAFPVDLEDSRAARAMVDDVVGVFEHLDLALLNAGGAPALDMRKMNADEVTGYMRSNYDVIVNCLFPVLDHMRGQGGGVIAHTNSLAGLIPVPLQGPYCAAKAAAKMLIDTCRLEFDAFDIKFVTLHPGFIATEATKDDGMPAPGEISEEEAVDHVMRAIAELKPNHLFPRRPGHLVRLLGAMPRSLRDRLLMREVPALPA